MFRIGDIVIAKSVPSVSTGLVFGHKYEVIESYPKKDKIALSGVGIGIEYPQDLFELVTTKDRELLIQALRRHEEPNFNPTYDLDQAYEELVVVSNKIKFIDTLKNVDAERLYKDLDAHERECLLEILGVIL